MDWPPPLPPRREVVLPGRGAIALREQAGPPGAETVMLLHGLTATADLNWFSCFEPLARQFRVLAPDARGHGAGMRVRRYRLEDCGEDVIELAHALDLERVLLVGYSMGGAVAQLVCRARPDLVDGVVLCATAATFPRHGARRLSYPLLYAASVLAGVAPAGVRDRILTRSHGGDGSEVQRWAGSELRRNDARTMLQAPMELSRFDSSAWLDRLDVRASVIVTARDQVVPPDRQRHLAASLPGATVHELDGTHGVFVHEPARFAATVERACLEVSGQA